MEGLGKAYDYAHSLACQVIEYLVKCGLDEFHRLEQATRGLTLANERIASMERELLRIRNSEAKGREAVAVRFRVFSRHNYFLINLIVAFAIPMEEFA